MAYINPNGELMNCLGCGCDTTRKNGYCSKCLPSGSRRFEHINDQRDRHSKNTRGDMFKMDTDGYYEDDRGDRDMEK